MEKSGIPENVNIYLNRTHNTLRANGLQRLIPRLGEREYIRLALLEYFVGLKETPKDLDWIYAQYTGK